MQVSHVRAVEVRIRWRGIWRNGSHQYVARGVEDTRCRRQYWSASSSFGAFGVATICTSDSRSRPADGCAADPAFAREPMPAAVRLVCGGRHCPPRHGLRHSLAKPYRILAESPHANCHRFVTVAGVPLASELAREKCARSARVRGRQIYDILGTISFVNLGMSWVPERPRTPDPGGMGPAERELVV
jgi:hypothetical protein